jgi:hypothetical protein
MVAAIQLAWKLVNLFFQNCWHHLTNPDGELVTIFTNAHYAVNAKCFALLMPYSQQAQQDLDTKQQAMQTMSGVYSQMSFSFVNSSEIMTL